MECSFWEKWRKLIPRCGDNECAIKLFGLVSFVLVDWRGRRDVEWLFLLYSKINAASDGLLGVLFAMKRMGLFRLDLDLWIKKVYLL